MAKAKSGIKAMKLIAIKNECYAISGVSNTAELRSQYTTLCKGRDFRKRESWEYLLKRLQTDGDWVGVKVSDIERAALEEQSMTRSSLAGVMTFQPERRDWDEMAEYDD